MNLISAILLSFFITLILTPLVIRFSYLIGAIDLPNERKVHSKGIPRIGGIAIIGGFIGGAIFLQLFFDTQFLTIFLGLSIIGLTGFLDDLLELKPINKLAGQIIATLLVVFLADIRIDYIMLPDNIRVDFGVYSYFISTFWILALTNAINLIDGLDGLAAGVSIIALSTIIYLSFANNQLLVLSLAILVIGSTAGFLIYNFHPARIFMGDTGSQFLGFIIAIISIMGLYKSVTIFSLFIPIIILGVPLFDTLFAILRRLMNGQSIGKADRSHIHHKLLEMGFTHKETVLIIYATCMIFGAIAITTSRVTLWQSFIVFITLALSVQVIGELIGLMGRNKIFLSIIKKLRYRK